MNSVPSTPLAATSETGICPVCRDDLFESPEFAGRQIAIVRSCGHKFHLDCLATWKIDHLTGPIGRTTIEVVEAEILTLPSDWQCQMINAAKVGDIGAVRALLTRGANVDADQTVGNTPMSWATFNEHYDVLLLLASWGGSDPIGLYRLGELFHCGEHSFPKDLRKAQDWYLKAVELRYIPAMNDLGLVYQHGGEGIPADPYKAEGLYLESSGLGNTKAMHNLGCLYKHGGVGFPRDPHKAKIWFHKAEGVNS